MELVKDLISRYNDEPPDGEDQANDLIDHLKLESLMQSLALYRGQQEALKKVSSLACFGVIRGFFGACVKASKRPSRR